MLVPVEKATLQEKGEGVDNWVVFNRIGQDRWENRVHGMEVGEGGITRGLDISEKVLFLSLLLRVCNQSIVN